MKPVFTSAEMRACDAEATAKYGVPSLMLMENAARGAADVLAASFNLMPGMHARLFCGKGNNGGDGFALARHLLNRGLVVTVYVACSEGEIAGDALINLRVLQRTLSDAPQLDVRFLDSSDGSGLATRADFIVDALLGTGLTAPVSGSMASLVRKINDSGVPVASIDIPTGIHADTGEILGEAVNAELTITMGGLKRGLLFFPGREYAGAVHVVDIGMPRQGFYERAASAHFIEDADVAQLLPVRAVDAHKYDAGAVGLIAGSAGYTGAAAMAAEAAQRSGAGLVILGIPRSLNSVMEAKLTEVMTRPLGDTGEGVFSVGAFEGAATLINGTQAGILGPGVSRHPEALELVRALIKTSRVPLVVDADGLAALVGHLDLLRACTAPIILTPHMGEFARLCGISADDIERNRLEAARAFAKQTNTILVLKGSPTVTATPDGRAFITVTGNPGMATAGSGDVLTGVIASLIAQGLTPETAAWTGAHVHGRAGDLAVRDTGTLGLIATDILRAIATTMRDLASPVAPAEG
ncbi:MAG: NAD(P)H-hydrate dehydratase [Ignavibacteria bacterium]|nr:NAD(P)H-hydrate dehydratase [Ignavibacteria bacterium]